MSEIDVLDNNNNKVKNVECLGFFMKSDNPVVVVVNGKPIVTKNMQVQFLKKAKIGIQYRQDVENGLFVKTNIEALYLM